MAENPSYKYNISIIILHWLMAFMFIMMIISGYFMTTLDPSISIYKWKIYGSHKSFGISFLILTIIRIIIRIKTYIPPYKYEFSKIVKTLSSITQKTFYLLFFIIPVTGYLGSVLAGYDVILFGYKIPNIFTMNPNLASKMHYLHSILPYISLIFVFLHISGVIKHRYFDKKDILERMW